MPLCAGNGHGTDASGAITGFFRGCMFTQSWAAPYDLDCLIALHNVAFYCDPCALLAIRAAANPVTVTVCQCSMLWWAIYRGYFISR
jgi:hypothetical protein